MSKIRAVYFSATGTTKKIVTCIANSLADGAAEQFDFTLPGSREKKAVFTGDDCVM